MSVDAILAVATVILHVVGVMTMHLTIGLAALLPAAVTVGGLLVATRREGPAPEWASLVAYREKRQCSNGVGGSVWSPPERCAYPADHWGECDA